MEGRKKKRATWLHAFRLRSSWVNYSAVSSAGASSSEGASSDAGVSETGVSEPAVTLLLGVSAVAVVLDSGVEVVEPLEVLAGVADGGGGGAQPKVNVTIRAAAAARRIKATFFTSTSLQIFDRWDFEAFDAEIQCSGKLANSHRTLPESRQIQSKGCGIGGLAR